MPIFTYEKYMDIIPKETKSFVKRLINYLYNNDCIEFSSFNIVGHLDKLFYKSIKAYKEESEKNRNILHVLRFEEKNYINNSNIGSDTCSKIFTEYYSAFVPFDTKEEYLLITPEDIIKNIHDKLMGDDKGYRTYNLIGISDKEFIKRLIEMSTPKKVELLEYYNKEFNKDYSISVINYFNMVGRIYTVLREKKDLIKHVETSNSDLKNLAMLIAVFYYNHVSSYKDSYNEKQIIIDYFNSRGLNINTIENTIGIHFNKEELEAIDSTLVLFDQFSDIKPYNTSRNNVTVGSLVNQLINNGYEDSLVIKKLLGACNLTISELSKVSEVLKSHREELNNNSLEDLYKGLLPNVISYLKRVARIYTYLQSKKDELDKSIVSNRSDLFTLAILLSTYEFNNKYLEFYNDKGLTIDKVLELAKLPSKDIYIKEVNETEPNEKEITRISNLVTGGVNNEIAKDAITPVSIITNSTDKKRTDSSLYQRIYKMSTGEKLDDSFTSQVDKYLKDKEEKRKRVLTEEVLNNIPIDVFNYLKILCSYYKILSTKGLDPKDLEQLSIILAASRFDKNVENYLNHLGMSRTSLAKAFKVDFSYQDKSFDIEVILGPLKPYIFDRPNEKITVYSIFENAFRPELTNTLNLRRVLYKFGKTPEEFLDLKSSLEEWKKEKILAAENDKQKELFAHCTEQTLPIIKDALRIYEYLTIDENKKPLLQSLEDFKTVSILISLFYNDDSYIPFFNHNGVTIETILKAIGLTPEIIENVRNKNYNPKTIFVFKDYFGDYDLSLKVLIRNIFNENINKSNLLRTITEGTDNNYEYLVEEVTSQKEREITPDQGIKILSSEEVVEIEDTSLGTIASYGLAISKHSKYINNALHDLISADTLDHSVEDLNNLLGEASYEEELPTPRKKGFFSRFFETEQPKPQIVRQVNLDKIDDIQTQVDIQIENLTKELKGYEYIKKYIEIFLQKLSEYLKYLKAYYSTISSTEVGEELDEIEKFTKTLDINSSKEIVLDKINTFETMILLMKQELVTVHRSIINHFVTINSLQTSKSAILPLIITEAAIGVGKQTESESLALTGDLLSLFQNVLNKNAEATKQNLERLRLSSISDETYSTMSREVNRYLESLNRSNALLEKTTSEQKVENDEHPTLKL